MFIGGATTLQNNATISKNCEISEQGGYGSNLDFEQQPGTNFRFKLQGDNSTKMRIVIPSLIIND